MTKYSSKSCWHASLHSTILLLAFFFVGFASVTVAYAQTNQVKLSQPPFDVIYIYDFAYSPTHVQLDRGIAARVAGALNSTPRSEREMQIGQQVAETITEAIVADLRAKGFPAQRGDTQSPQVEGSLLVRGQLVSIDEGNRTARVVIGLGIGRTDVQADVQVIEVAKAGDENVDQFKVSVASRRKPGVAVAAGAGAIAGRLLLSAAVSGATSAASETWGANVEADARRLAKKVSKKLLVFFSEQGWVSP